MSVTVIENLSNEFFYELFDYLDGYDIYQSFSNLNYRFQQLLKSSSLLFKIKYDSSDEEFSTDFKQFILLNKHKLFSLNLTISYEDEDFLSLIPIDSSFQRLESVVINEIEQKPLYSLLSNLTSLPRLFFLTMDISFRLNNLKDLYRLIFSLSKLKYIKCSAADTDTYIISLPFASKDQTSTIEHLDIDHNCTFNELSILLSYTPQLQRLNFSHSDDSNSKIGSLLPMKLSNLTSIYFDIPYITFDEFKIFITKLHCPLKSLHFITRSEDTTYLDANEWEDLILNHLSQLNNFYFEYEAETEYECDYSIDLEDFNRFNSSFWIERKWIFETEIDLLEIKHFIRPNKKTWYDIQPSKSLRLILIPAPHDEHLQIPMINIQYISTETEFYHLEIQKDKIDFGTLINITYNLSELDSLKLHSLSLLPGKSLSMEETIRRLVSHENKITKVCLENMVHIEEVYFLIKFCPHINYLQVNCMKTMDVGLFLYRILNKISAEKNYNLCSLCIGLPKADNKMVEELKEMINSKNLLFHYTIRFQFDKIYLQWQNE